MPVPAETFFRPLIKGSPVYTAAMDIVLGGTNPFANRTVVGSGVVSVTVSTNVVNSDSLILTGSVITSGGIISSAGQIVVNSIVPGVSFAFTRDSGVAAPWTSTVMWMIVGPK